MVEATGRKIQMALWAGLPAVALLVYILVFDQAGQIDSLDRKVKRLHREYTKMYVKVPQPAVADKDFETIDERLNDQEQQLAMAESALVVPLPSNYTVTRYRS